MMREMLIGSELFEMMDNTLYIIENKPLYTYNLSPGKSVIKFFDNLSTIYYYVIKNLEDENNKMTMINFQDTYELICTNEINIKYLNCFNIMDEDWKIYINKINKNKLIDVTNPHDFNIFLKLFYKEQEYHFQSLGYEVKGRSIYSKEEDFANNIPRSKNKIINRIQEYLHVYPGFELHLKNYNNKHYIHIKPKSTIIFEKDLYSLYNENIMDLNTIEKYIEYVYLPINRTGKLIGFINNKANDNLTQKPFKSMSFLKYAKFVHKLPLKAPEAQLMILNVRGRYPVWYFSSELSKPSFSFRTLSVFDPDYVGNITSKMKVYSSKRVDILEQLENKFNLSIFNINVKLGPIYSRLGSDVKIDYENINNLNNVNPFIIFKRPNIILKNTYGNIVEIGEFTNHYAYPGDLLRDRTLRPLDVPDDIYVNIISYKDQEKDAKILIEKIQNGLGKYPSFKELFNCEMHVNSFTSVDNFLETSVFDNITRKDDCVLLIGPRVLDDPIETIKIYTHTKKICMARGIPAQFIADEPRRNPIYDGSLISKSKKPDTLFGISLNILGKIGARVLETSPKCTNQFLSDSVVLGYNIARIFEPLSEKLMSVDSPGDLVRKSIPLSAPIVIMNEHGSEIIHQDIYEILNETDLFSGNRGARISSQIPSKYEKILVHKDGPFQKKELVDLKKLQDGARFFIPISIVSGGIPRLFSTMDVYKYRPPIGLVFPLSDNEYLMSTTFYSPSSLPEKSGWPNPIKIKVHDEILPKKLDTNEKIRILYQMWALTRTYSGTQIPTRRPFSIHYSNKMAEFLRKAGEREPEYFKRFKNIRNNHNYMPRMFL